MKDLLNKPSSFKGACDEESPDLHQNNIINKAGYTYILSNKKNGVLYIGVTSDLQQRIYQHKKKLFPGFTSKYNLDVLVRYQEYNNIQEAIAYEKN